MRFENLTGLPGREALDRKLRAEWQRERRPAEPTAVILVEVNACGYQGSGQDKAESVMLMQALEIALERALPRRVDLLVRYNEVTFGVVLPGTDLPGSLRVAARLRWAVSHPGPLHARPHSGNVSATIGVAVQHGLLNSSSAALVKAAEGALLRARQGSPDNLEHVLIEGPDREDPEASPLRRLSALRGRPEKHARAWQ